MSDVDWDKPLEPGPIKIALNPDPVKRLAEEIADKLVPDRNMHHHWQCAYDGALAGILRASEAERSQILAWLEDTIFGDDDLDMASITLANRIARGEHLKG